MTAGCGADTGSPTAAPASTGALVDIGAGLSGPSGLVATVYSQGPTKVSTFALDPSGRLWLATSDSVDAGQDGVYLVPASGSAPVQVITGVHTPLGLLWLGDSLYVSSKEQVEAYTGFDGTTFTDRRTVLTLPTDVGESNGLALAPDGRIVLGISSPCDSCTPASAESAAVVSFRPDGSDLQVVARGIRAPVGLTYFPSTDDLFVTMNQRDDLGDATPGDWLGVVEQGQDWGFPDCYGQGGDACAGAPSPVAELDQHAAVSGVAITTGQLGAAVGTSALVAEWATGTVKRVALTTDGSTYTGTPGTFLTGLTNPVPLIMTTSGSLLVGDWSTGTIYEISNAT
ncbi:MAG: PQQ-dependent sugar dehydrogenase [Acidimicrobiales bacterium]